MNSSTIKSKVLNFIGVLLILFFVIRFIFLIREGVLVHVFWVCNHAMLIMGIAILMRNSFLLLAELSFAFMGAFVWIFDFVSKVVFDFHVFGSTDYLFPVVDKGFFAVTTMVHFLSVPLGFSAFFLIKKKQPLAWKGGLIHAIILIPFSVFFGEYYNLNCFLNSCVSWLPTFPLYPVFFLFVYFIIFVIPLNWILNKVISK